MEISRNWSKNKQLTVEYKTNSDNVGWLWQRSCISIQSIHLSRGQVLVWNSFLV
eukprot:CCRYP_003019-RA/>CCRYP_003019-RA protein AED:0.44 eAED:0.44 QI:196/1/1/1/0/0/3/44/53